MNTTCPHCSAQIEIDTETLAALQGHPQFVCPSCQGLVEVPPPSGQRPVAPLRGTPNAPSRRPAANKSAGSSTAALAKAHRGINRNILILGSVTLLVLGGLGFFLASHSGGNTINNEQKITNQIISNSYFQNLIASGDATKKDFEGIEIIRPYGETFIGISKEPLGWDQARDLAERTGAEVLEIKEGESGSVQSMLDWLKETFSDNLLSAVWIRQISDPRVLDGPDILSVTAMDRKRKVLLAWGLSKTVETPHPESDLKFESLFNGRDLSGWDGDPRFWSVSEGVINGESPFGGTVPNNTCLIWKGGEIADFELRLSYRIIRGNSGVQYRSTVRDPATWRVGGYQYEISPDPAGSNGALYDEGGQRKGLAHPGGDYMAGLGEMVRFSAEGVRTVTSNLEKTASFRPGYWNELTIIAKGNRLIQKLNGVVTIDLIDDETGVAAAKGVLALQLHGGKDQKVQFKGIQLSKISSAGPWIDLFNGQDVSHWRGKKQDSFPEAAWTVDGGILRDFHGQFDQNLVTRDTYRNFELEFEWRVNTGGNSGIVVGPREYQIVDDLNNVNGKVSTTSTGALCYFIAPNSMKRLNPAGEFNKGRLVVNGNHVEHWLNGEKILEFELGSAELKMLVEKAEYKYLPGFPNDTSQFSESCDAPIELQTHGGNVGFRHIRIRSLDSSATANP